MYESDHTKFIRELIQKSPDLPQQQKVGREIWWDKILNAEFYAGFSASRVAQPPYVYQNLPNGIEVQNNYAEPFQKIS